jgi:hypothetical protein
MPNPIKSIVDRIAFWWGGPDRQVIGLSMHEDGGMTFSFPDPNYLAPRDRFDRMITKQPTKWILAIISGVVVVVLGAAITKVLGLT